MKILTILLFLILSLHLAAQMNPDKLKLGIISGYAFYQHDDLKTANWNVISQIPFDARVIDNFEPPIFFGGYVQYKLLRHLNLGPVYEYHYTGSRIGARDYSGLYSFDQYLNAHQIGLKIDYALVALKSLVFNLQLNGGSSFTDWRMDSRLQFAGEEDYAEYKIEKFKGQSWYAAPGLNLEYEIYPRIILTGAASWFFDIAGKYKYLYNRNLDIVNYPDWSGMKLTAGIAFSLNKGDDKISYKTTTTKNRVKTTNR
jgi:hypothetical protein